MLLPTFKKAWPWGANSKRVVRTAASAVFVARSKERGCNLFLLRVADMSVTSGGVAVRWVSTV